MSMKPTPVVDDPTIRKTLAEFLQEKARSLPQSEVRLYRRVVFFLELCINNYGHRNLGEFDRARCEQAYRAEADDQRLFYEMFGPEQMLPELDFFNRVFLKQNVHTTETVIAKASEVTAALKSWLMERRYLSAASLERAERRSRARAKYRVQAQRARDILVSFTERRTGSEPQKVPARDFVDLDDHPISRLEPGRMWLRIFDTDKPPEIGPLIVPLAATEHLDVGWNLSCGLSRVDGLWHLAEVDEVYPTVA